VSDCGAWLDIPTLSALAAAMPALTALRAPRCVRLAASAHPAGGPLALFHALRPVARTLRVLDLSSCRVHPTALLALLSFLPALEEVALARCFRAAPPPRRARRAASWGGGSGGDNGDDGGDGGGGDDEDMMRTCGDDEGCEDDPDALNACAMGDLECVIGTILACRSPRALNLSGNACVGALLRSLTRSRCAHEPPFFAHHVARHGAGPSLARLDLRGCGLRGGCGGADGLHNLLRATFPRLTPATLLVAERPLAYASPQRLSWAGGLTLLEDLAAAWAEGDARAGENDVALLGSTSGFVASYKYDTSCGQAHIYILPLQRAARAAAWRPVLRDAAGDDENDSSALVAYPQRLARRAGAWGTPDRYGIMDPVCMAATLLDAARATAAACGFSCTMRLHRAGECAAERLEAALAASAWGEHDAVRAGAMGAVARDMLAAARRAEAAEPGVAARANAGALRSRGAHLVAVVEPPGGADDDDVALTWLPAEA
jgi:hypothetical protein